MLVDPGQHAASIPAQACQFDQARNSQGSAGFAGARCQGKEIWPRAWRQVLICLYLSNIITIQAALLEVLAPKCFQGLALIQSALPAVIALLVGSLHALAMYTESRGTPKLFA